MARKPHGIASTFGETSSLLEQAIESHERPIPELQKQWSQYSHEELGLVNRLDNVTSGLLFFAKTPAIYHTYKTLQAQNHVQKIYYADLYGCIVEEVIVQTPIYHHYSDSTRMTTQKQNSRGKAHYVVTQVIPITYDKDSHSTMCKILIQKGARHQIRIHTASIGHHVIGDVLYAPKQYRDQYVDNSIHLWSMGMHI